jgi:hypothetical protein
MDLNTLALQVEATRLSLAIAESDWLFPTLEAAHVAALALVVGSISIVDLRLLGLASRRRAPEELAAAVLPLTWIGFAFAATSGLLMFAAKPTSYLANPFFIGKLALLAAAGLNVALFHLVLGRRLASVGRDLLPVPIRISAGVSLTLWVAIVAFGRWIGFSL